MVFRTPLPSETTILSVPPIPILELIFRTRTFPELISSFSVGVVVPMPTYAVLVTAKSLVCCTAEGAPDVGLSLAPSI